jgi:hypothetical protein
MLTVGGWHGLREILQIHELNGKRGVGSLIRIECLTDANC